MGLHTEKKNNINSTGAIMKLTEKHKHELHEAYFKAGFGFKATVPINKTTKITLSLDDSGDMNPATITRVYKKGKLSKSYHCYSEKECISAIRKHN